MIRFRKNHYMRTLWACMIAGTIVFQASHAHATTQQMGVKLTRGLLNVSTGWMEVPYRMEESLSANGPGPALTWGVINGLGRTIGRAVVGVYEIISSPFPGPENYEPILTDPVYFLKDSGRE